MWFVGDLVDRGPDGVAAIELVMRLEREGDVHCLLGNHEAGLISVVRLADVECVFRSHLKELWEMNGGMVGDLARLRPEHISWIEGLPAVAVEGDRLLVHSDTDSYLQYGGSVDAICREISAIVSGSDPDAFGRLLEVLADREAFGDPERLERLLGGLGCRRVVHGHTPIWYVTGADPARVDRPLVYAEGRALNVDHGLYSGGAGFVVELD